MAKNFSESLKEYHRKGLISKKELERFLEEIESECCKARMIGGVQCEVCGSDGKIEDEREWAEAHGAAQDRETGEWIV